MTEEEVARFALQLRGAERIRTSDKLSIRQ